MTTGAGGLHMAPEWANRLRAAGLDSFDALYGTERGEEAHRHDRSWTQRVELAGGEVLYLKCDVFTTFKQIVTDLLHLRRPQPLSEKERQGIERVSALGVATARPVAWGQRRRLGLPHRGVLAMTELSGGRVDDYLDARPPAEQRRAVLAAVGRTLRTLYGAGLSWPDLRVKHVYVDPPGKVGLLDLERLEPRSDAPRRMPRQVRRFCRELREHGADDGDTDALLDGFGRPDGLREL